MTKKVGRPAGSVKIEVTDEMLKTVEKLAGVGLTHEQISNFLEIDPKTWYRYRNQCQDINARFLKGRANADARLATSLYQQAVTEKNTTAGIFLAKARLGWSEKKQPDELIEIDLGDS